MKQLYKAVMYVLTAKWMDDRSPEHYGCSKTNPSQPTIPCCRMAVWCYILFKTTSYMKKTIHVLLRMKLVGVRNQHVILQFTVRFL